MAFEASSDDRLDQLERSADEIEKKVDVIYGGRKKLTDANKKSDERFATIENRLGSVELSLEQNAVAIEKIELRSGSEFGKPHGKDTQDLPILNLRYEIR